MKSYPTVLAIICLIFLVACSGDSAVQTSTSASQESNVRGSTPAPTAIDSSEASATSTTVPTATKQATTTPAPNSDGGKKEEATQSTATAIPTPTAVPFPLDRPYELVFTTNEDFAGFPDEQ